MEAQLKQRIYAPEKYSEFWSNLVIRAKFQNIYTAIVTTNFINNLIQEQWKRN